MIRAAMRVRVKTPDFALLSAVTGAVLGLGLGLGLALELEAYGLPNEVAYTIEATLDPQRNVVRGREVVEFTNKTGQALDALYFHVYPNAFKRGSNSFYQQELREKGRVDPDVVYANPDDDAFLTVERVVRLDLEGAQPAIPLRFSIEDTLLTVELDEPLPDGASLKLEIEFVYDLMEAAPGARMAARWAVRSGHRDGVYTLALWYPKLAVYDERGWHLEPYGYIGEFYGDFARYAVQLTVPSDFVVGATGRLVWEATATGEDGEKVLRFEAENVHDFAWVASPRYRVRALDCDGVTLYELTLGAGPGLAGLGERACRALRFFNRAFGPYAYGQLTVAEVTVGGGMEYPQIVMIGRGSDYEVAHEVAHQWWYGAVGNDEFDEAWLDEGFATYAQELYFIEELGYAPGAARSTWTFREPGEPVLQPASAFPSLQSYFRAVYAKASGVLWMLRWLLGAEAFGEALRAYYERFTFRNATTGDFVAVVEGVSGRELDWFFEPWLRTTATLNFVLEDVESERLPSGLWRHVARLRREGPIVMPVDVRFTMDDGRAVTLRWAGTRPEGTLAIEGAQPLARVEVDPERWVLEEERRDNVWEGRTVALSSSAPPSSLLLGLGLLSFLSLLVGVGGGGRPNRRTRVQL